MVVTRSPATTCASVTTYPGATTKPLPCCNSSHAVPLTRTTESATRRRTDDEIGIAPGASPTAGTLPTTVGGREESVVRFVRQTSTSSATAAAAATVSSTTTMIDRRHPWRGAGST